MFSKEINHDNVLPFLPQKAARKFVQFLKVFPIPALTLCGNVRRNGCNFAVFLKVLQSLLSGATKTR
jgi:hypothetical protein